MSLVTTLKPHQEEAIQWMVTRKQGLLLDEPGLGKTLQMICVILDGLRSDSGEITLIVSPASVMHVWYKEFKKHTDLDVDAKVVVYHGKGRKKKVTEDTRIMITTYGTLLSEFKNKSDVLYGKQFTRLVLDEAHTVRNSNTLHAGAVMKVNATYKWIVTATPVFNSRDDMFIYFWLLKKVSQIEKWRSLSDDVVKQMVSKYGVRRVKNEILSLNLTAKEEQIVHVDMSDKEKYLYNLLLKAKEYDIQKAVMMISSVLGKQPLNYRNLEQAMKTLMFYLLVVRQGCANQPVAVMKANKTKLIGEVDKAQKELDAVMKTKEKRVYNVKTDYKDHDYTRVKVMFDIVERHLSAGEKVVVSSQWVTSLKYLRRKFAEKYPDVKTSIIYGDMNIKKRTEAIEQFQEDDEVKVVFVSLMACSEGVTLTAGNVIIHADLWWNSQKTLQMTDRVHRIGQGKQVYVYTIVIKGTIDEEMMKLIESKTAIVDEIVDNKDPIRETEESEETAKGIVWLARRLKLVE